MEHFDKCQNEISGSFTFGYVFNFVDIFVKFSFHGTINKISFKMYRIEYHQAVDRQGTSPDYD